MLEKIVATAPVIGASVLLVGALASLQTTATVTPPAQLVEPPQLVVHPAEEPACEIMEHGLYEAMSERIRHEDPTSVTGEWSQIELVRFVEEANVIPMELGRGFGFRFRVRDPGSLVTWRTTYPEPGIRDHDAWSRDFVLDRHSSWVGYQFDYDWELVPGAWRIEVIVDGRPGCSMQFDVR